MKLSLILTGLAIAAIAVTSATQPARKLNVAHRGASAYAPEHTLAAYRLALAQGADYVEQDLAVTKDGELICLHGIDGGPPDFPGLERTTNVEELFPDRSTTIESNGRKQQVWLSTDFTLAEIKTLDAGSWFDKKFAGSRIPTLQEAIDAVGGKAGLFIELKAADFYHARDIAFESRLADVLRTNKLAGPNRSSDRPTILQTFSEASVIKLAALNLRLPIVQLIYTRDAALWGNRERVVTARQSGATGLGPSKVVVEKNPQLITWAHAEGMTVVPYTFRSSNTGRHASVRAEMEHFLYTLGVDGLFTDNPDQFPRR